MFKLIPYSRDHILPMLEQDINSGTKSLFTSEQLAVLEKTEAFTATVNGVPLFCGGVVKCWEGRGMIWSVFSAESKTNFVPLFRGLKKALRELPYNRLEIAIPYNFDIGKRRASMLGFQVECELAKKFLPGGEDCSLYAWVRD